MERPVGIICCRRQDCVTNVAEIFCLRLSREFSTEYKPRMMYGLTSYTVQGTVSVSYCACITLHEALRAKGLYLVGLEPSPVALSVDVLDLYCALRTVSKTPVAPIYDLLGQYFDIKGAILVSKPLLCVCITS